MAEKRPFLDGKQRKLVGDGARDATQSERNRSSKEISWWGPASATAREGSPGRAGVKCWEIWSPFCVCVLKATPQRRGPNDQCVADVCGGRWFAHTLYGLFQGIRSLPVAVMHLNGLCWIINIPVLNMSNSFSNLNKNCLYTKVDAGVSLNVVFLSQIVSITYGKRNNTNVCNV